MKYKRLKGKVIAVDTETTGLNPYNNSDRIFAYIFANVDGETMMLYEKDDPENIRAFVRDWMADPGVVKVFHNAKFDIKMLAKNNIEVVGRYHCTMVLGHTLGAQGPAGPDHKENCLSRLSMATLSTKYLDIRKQDAVKNYISANKKQFSKMHDRSMNYSDVPRDIMTPYGQRDGEVTLSLFYLFYPNVRKLGLMSVYKREMSLMKHIIAMEDRGVRLDVPFMQKRVIELTDRANVTEARMRKTVQPITIRKKKKRVVSGRKVNVYKRIELKPEEINFGSEIHLNEIVHNQLKLPVIAKTATGKPSLDERALSRHNNKFVKDLIRWRQYVKVRDVYFKGYQEHIADDGFLHPNYIQIGTNTGRFSSASPNLQNIPMEKQVRERAGADVVYKGVKRCFVPRKGFTNWHFDYSQVELRMFAHESRDPRVMDIMTSGRDLHSETCVALYGEVTEHLRVLAKIVNFGILYGMGKKTFAWKLKCDAAKVEELLSLYYTFFPGVRDFQQRVISQVRRHGTLTNAFGRRYVIDSRCAYKGVNYLCQGGAADALKKAIIRVGDLLCNYKSNMLMTIHDELVCEIHKDEEHFLPKQIIRLMGHNPELTIPLKVSAEIAVGSWDNLKKMSYEELGLEPIA